MEETFRNTANIHAARKPKEDAGVGQDDSAKIASLEISPVEWGMIMALCGVASIIELVFAETIVIPFLVNYAAVFIIWFWAKIKGLKPPTFARNAAKARALVKAAEQHAKDTAEGGVEKALDSIPGMDLVYIGLGGINPFFYGVALFIGNMS
jgi:hypothetical protein